MKITRLSPLSEKVHTMDLPVTPEQLEAWQNGALIQNAMPNLSAAEREFIKTGLTEAEERDRAFPVNERKRDESSKATPASDGQQLQPPRPAATSQLQGPVCRSQHRPRGPAPRHCSAHPPREQEMKHHHLTLKEQLLLTKFVESEYRTSGYTTNKFAQHATNKLGFPIGFSQAQRALEALDMEPNRMKNKLDMSAALGLVARVQTLEERVEKLAEHIRRISHV